MIAQATVLLATAALIGHLSIVKRAIYIPGLMLLLLLVMAFLCATQSHITISQITHATDVPSTVQHVKLVLIGLLLNARVATWLLGSTPRRKHAIPFLHVILQDTTI